jgi:hypothetical protein
MKAAATPRFSRRELLVGALGGVALASPARAQIMTTAPFEKLVGLRKEWMCQPSKRERSTASSSPGSNWRCSGPPSFIFDSDAGAGSYPH